MNVRIGVSKTGLGLFAYSRLEDGEKIVEYTGEYITNSEADKRKENRYLFEVDPQSTIDGSTRKNIARYINHSCEPNAEVRIYKKRIFIFAARDIEKGEEITIDYGIEYFNDFIKLTGCQCGAEKHLA